jgi:hypothetical protein
MRELLRMLFARQLELRDEVVAERAGRFWREAERLHVLDVEIMLLRVRVLEGDVGGVAPAIRLAGQERDAFGRGRRVHLDGKIFWQRGDGKFVDDAVALVIPRAQRRRGQGQHDEKGGQQFHTGADHDRGKSIREDQFRPAACFH